jgi:hypothetical protein
MIGGAVRDGSSTRQNLAPRLLQAQQDCHRLWVTLAHTPFGHFLLARVGPLLGKEVDTRGGAVGGVRAPLGGLPFGLWLHVASLFRLGRAPGNQ